MKSKKLKMTATQVILLGFLGAILVGSFLLSIPASSADGTWTPWVDALFTATTSVCVTGLTVVDTYAHFSLFGKIIVLILIQLGGLGVISFSTAVLLLFQKRINLEGNILLGSAFNLDTLGGLVEFLGKVFAGTLLVEGVGAVLCLPVFIPQYGPKGIWISVFHSISAFCNAGIDIIGPDSLMPYVGNVWLNLVTMALIILGGLGFIVWMDVLEVGGQIRRGRLAGRRAWSALSLHSKLTITTTGILIIGGAILFAILEWNNPGTLGELNPGTKILASFFQSVTLRTAGFASIPQSELKNSSVVICIILMFIGGSSVSTAGGVKTGTVALVVLSTMMVVRGGDRVVAYGRTIPAKLVQRALAIVSIALGTFFVATILLGLLYDGSFADVAYESASALGTAGLSRGVCGQLGVLGKTLIIACMYLGRVGPISLATAFAYRSNADRIKYPEKDITIG